MENAAERMLSTAAMRAALLQERALRAFGQTDTDMKEEWTDDTGDD